MILNLFEKFLNYTQNYPGGTSGFIIWVTILASAVGFVIYTKLPEKKVTKIN